MSAEGTSAGSKAGPAASSHGVGQANARHVGRRAGRSPVRPLQQLALARLQPLDDPFHNILLHPGVRLALSYRAIVRPVSSGC
ncbi:hypothetical protein [Paenibacillus humicola]|uniref:hypothetical protein n=1 Tax=Paenibacillus humicola TaxID=3110540 RepID=UPI00237A9154|nr:hypothetical protein [Paenibacillus humicola]